MAETNVFNALNKRGKKRLQSDDSKVVKEKNAYIHMRINWKDTHQKTKKEMNPPPNSVLRLWAQTFTGHDYLSPFQFLCSRPVLPLLSQTNILLLPWARNRNKRKPFRFLLSFFKFFVSGFLASAHCREKTRAITEENKRRRNWKRQLQMSPSSCYFLIVSIPWAPIR